MRLWHTDLIEVLPRQQLLGQWRELNSIFKNQNKHVLINFVYKYDISHLYVYGLKVIDEIEKRGYKVNKRKFDEYFDGFVCKEIYKECFKEAKPFAQKMTDRYLRQCYYNLQEKYDCGGITEEEWEKIESKVKEKGEYND
ncbi:pyrimidine dimer DNA glycosylase/endonuclease V [uncultured Coprobacter sp.]|uniref:pyrimidine dimer DNA glycosylase/endonuclease V n=1 Tax=uncultured Coprobacter sp. TaxID=1720550 RepID=UPI0026159098|nr:pyrimidine dimer DNA glycosylase/endonuclease V [uncultured Coprobacter sp.]